MSKVVFLCLEYTVTFLIINFNVMRGCSRGMQNNGENPYLGIILVIKNTTFGIRSDSLGLFDVFGHF